MSTAPSIIIGLVGKKRAGKDTFAQALVEERGYTKVAFADALRAVLAAADPILHTAQPTSHSAAWRLSDELERYSWDTAKDLPEVRRLLQELGNGVREALDPSVWFTPVYRAMSRPDVEHVVVTDVRYPNEADLIESLGGTLVRIVRPTRGLPEDMHVTEVALDRRPTPYVVHNDQGAEELREQALAIHTDLTRPHAAVQI